jgi:predicted phosphoribosyltransferase
MYFKNRIHAGKLLSNKLASLIWDRKNTVIIALPRGGVPVAHEVAKDLGFPMDIVIVKKIGTPADSELAIGAICEDDGVYFNPELMNYFGYDQIDMEPFKLRAKDELLKTSEALRKGRATISLENKDIILIDDGIATGSTMEVVLQLLKRKNVKNITIAVPVASPEIVRKFVPQVEKVVTVISPEFLTSVGQWYDDFRQIETNEVVKILSEYLTISKIAVVPSPYV